MGSDTNELTQKWLDFFAGPPPATEEKEIETPLPSLVPGGQEVDEEVKKNKMVYDQCIDLVIDATTQAALHADANGLISFGMWLSALPIVIFGSDVVDRRWKTNEKPEDLKEEPKEEPKQE